MSTSAWVPEKRPVRRWFWKDMVTHLAFSHTQLTRQFQNLVSELPALLLDLGGESSHLCAILLNIFFVPAESLPCSCNELVCHFSPANRVTICLAQSLSVGRNEGVPDVDPWTVERDSCGCRWQTSEELTHRLIELSCADHTLVRIVGLAMLTPVLAHIESIRFLVQSSHVLLISWRRL